MEKEIVLVEQRLREQLESKTGFGTPRKQQQFLINFFKKFDYTKDGSLDYQEFSQALQTMNFILKPAVLRGMYDKWDANGDGTVDYGEFAQGLYGGKQPSQKAPAAARAHDAQMPYGGRSTLPPQQPRGAWADSSAPGQPFPGRPPPPAGGGREDFEDRSYSQSGRDGRDARDGRDGRDPGRDYGRGGRSDDRDYGRDGRGDGRDDRDDRQFYDRNREYGRNGYGGNRDLGPATPANGSKASQRISGGVLPGSGTCPGADPSAGAASRFSTSSAHYGPGAAPEEPVPRPASRFGQSKQPYANGSRDPINRIYGPDTQLSQRFGGRPATNPPRTTGGATNPPRTTGTTGTGSSSTIPAYKTAAQARPAYNSNTPRVGTGPPQRRQRAAPLPEFKQAQPSDSEFGQLILEAFRKKLTDRGSIHGLASLARVFKSFDDNGNKKMNEEELREGLLDFGMKLSKQDSRLLFDTLDKNKSGSIEFDEFVVAIRGPLNKFRFELVMKAFSILDKTGDGLVTIEDLAETYNTASHPRVKAGTMTHEQCLREFMAQWDSVDGDGIVTPEEFMDYYKNVSSSIDTDDYFERMMLNAWHMDGSDTNLRVLVTHTNGREEIVTIRDDLGLDVRDNQAIRRKLEQQGVRDIKRVSLS